MTAGDALLRILRPAGVSDDAGAGVAFTGRDPVLPSRHPLGAAAAAALAAVGLSAADLWWLRTGRRQRVAVDQRAAGAALRSERYARDDGKTLERYAPVSGYYRTRDDRWIQLHCNFPHHRNGTLALPSLVQSTSGFVDTTGERPRPLPAQVLDHVSGFLMACGAMVALARRVRDGGSWLVRVSLVQTAEWLHGLGRLDGVDPRTVADPTLDDVADLLVETDTPFGRVRHVRPVVELSETPARWTRPAAPPGTHPPAWPPRT